MSSHMFEEVEKTCDRIGIIKDGRMVADDGTEALKARYTKSYTVTLGDKAAAERLYSILRSGHLRSAKSKGLPAAYLTENSVC